MSEVVCQRQRVTCDLLIMLSVAGRELQYKVGWVDVVFPQVLHRFRLHHLRLPELHSRRHSCMSSWWQIYILTRLPKSCYNFKLKWKKANIMIFFSLSLRGERLSFFNMTHMFQIIQDAVFKSFIQKKLSHTFNHIINNGQIEFGLQGKCWINRCVSLLIENMPSRCFWELHIRFCPALIWCRIKDMYSATKETRDDR